MKSAITTNLTTIKASVVLVFAFAILVACGGETTTNTAKTTANVATPTPEMVAKITSKHPIQLFTENCAACHQESGKGGKMTTAEGKTINPDDLTSAKMKAKTDAQLTKYIADGIPDEGMPAFKDKLTEKDIANLVIHLRWLQGETKETMSNKQ